MDRLQRREKAELERAEELLQQDEDAARALDLALSVPGIGKVTAIQLLGLFRRYPDANREEMVALVELDPIEKRSGTSLHGKSRISKRGDTAVRKNLYQATLSGARYNPKLRAVYTRLKKRGKPEKVARTAAARKLLLIAHAIYRTREPFRASNVRACRVNKASSASAHPGLAAASGDGARDLSGRPECLGDRPRTDSAARNPNAAGMGRRGK